MKTKEMGKNGARTLHTACAFREPSSFHLVRSLVFPRVPCSVSQRDGKIQAISVSPTRCATCSNVVTRKAILATTCDAHKRATSNEHRGERALVAGAFHFVLQNHIYSSSPSTRTGRRLHTFRCQSIRPHCESVRVTIRQIKRCNRLATKNEYMPLVRAIRLLGPNDRRIENSCVCAAHFLARTHPRKNSKKQQMRQDISRTFRSIYRGRMPT